MTDLLKLEYRVKKKTVYFVTRYCQVGDEVSSGSSITEEGYFLDSLTAQRVALALCASDHARDGLPDGDPRVIGPEPLVYGALPAA